MCKCKIGSLWMSSSTPAFLQQFSIFFQNCAKNFNFFLRVLLDWDERDECCVCHSTIEQRNHLQNHPFFQTKIIDNFKKIWNFSIFFFSFYNETTQKIRQFAATMIVIMTNPTGLFIIKIIFLKKLKIELCVKRNFFFEKDFQNFYLLHA